MWIAFNFVLTFTIYNPGRSESLISLVVNCFQFRSYIYDIQHLRKRMMQWHVVNCFQFRSYIYDIQQLNWNPYAKQGCELLSISFLHLRYTTNYVSLKFMISCELLSISFLHLRYTTHIPHRYRLNALWIAFNFVLTFTIYNFKCRCIRL